MMGIVTLDGRPLGNKSVMFIPEPGTPGNGASASTDQDGRYSPAAIIFGATRNYPGIPPGRYRVTVNEYTHAARGLQSSGRSGDPSAAVRSFRTREPFR